MARPVNECFVMSYLDRVKACNRLDLGGHRPFMIDGRQFGWVSEARAEVLKTFADVFAVTHGSLTFAPGLTSSETRSAAVTRIVPSLAKSPLFAKPRGELYAVKRQWSE